jgi:2-methylcitrate dehydratase PrpD
MGATETLARFVLNTPSSAIPDPILHEGKRCIINYLGVALYASADPSMQILTSLFKEEGGNPQAGLIGSDMRTSLQNAALANGYLAHLEDYDDTHFPTVIHPSAPTIPAAMAVGERQNATGLDVLTATVLGVEACCRIGLSVHPHHYNAGWHITGTCGVFGSVVATGRLLGLDEGQMINALGIAGTQAAGVRETFGSMSKPFHAGRSAQSGVLAGLLAGRGFTSTSEILEGRRGFAAVLSTSSDMSQITDALGERWELPNNGLKPYACGVVSHPLIDAMIIFRNTHGVKPEDVLAITANVQPLVLELMDRQHPRIGLEGKFSHQHSMAVGLVDGGAFPAQYTDERVLDPTITALREVIKATVDPKMPEDAAEVTVKLKDGRSITEKVDHATGAPENPLSDSQLEDKFRNLVGRVLSKDQGEKLLATLWDIDKVENVGEIMVLARP